MPLLGRGQLKRKEEAHCAIHEAIRCRTEVTFVPLTFLFSCLSQILLVCPPPLFFWWIKVKFKDWRSSGWAKQGPLFNKYALTTYCLPGTAVCIGITKIRKLLEYNGTHNNSTKCCKNTVNWVTALNVLYLNLSLIQFVCVLALPVLPYNPGSFLLTKNLSYSIYLFLHVYRKKRISSYFQYLKF